jgi:hypothetical protein
MLVDRWHTMTERQRTQFFAAIAEERVGGDNEGLGILPAKRFKRLRTILDRCLRVGL